MLNKRNTPLQVATKGFLSGMGGALVLTVLLKAARMALGAPKRNPDGEPGHSSSEQSITAGEALSEDPGLPPAMDRVTAVFVQKVATGIFGTSLTPRQQYLAGFTWHLAYGGFWGVIYSLARSSTRTTDLSLIPAHGLGVWLVGPGWLVPRMDLMLPPPDQRPQTIALTLGGHLSYSTATGLLFRWLQAWDREPPGRPV